MGHISCIGFSNPLELLSLQGFSIYSDDSGRTYCSEFLDKKIVDFGAGVSPFLNTILEISTPREVLAVDPIYESDVIYNTAVVQTLLATQKAISNTSEGEALYEMLQKRKELLKLRSHHDPRILKRSSMREVGLGKYDYIFATDVLFHMKDTLLTLGGLGLHLNETGRLIVSDSHVNINRHSGAMNYLQAFIEGGVPGISVLGEDKSHISIGLEKGVLDAIRDILNSEKSDKE